MTLISEATKRAVISIRDARTVGVVAGFLIDPETSRVVALRVADTSSSGDTLRWEDLTAFGPDAVTVASEDLISLARGRAADIATRDFNLLGKRLLSDTGVELGRVDDVEFDPGTGAIEYLISSADRIAGSRLLGCGRYAVIVRAV